MAYGVVFLHGLGDVGSSWRFLKQHVAPSLPAGGEWLFPNAPTQPVSVNGGMRMTSWFDIVNIPLDTEEEAEGLTGSIEKVHRLIDGLVEKGIPSERIIVGGFSQGAAVTLQAILRYPKKLAGGVMLSGWILRGKDLQGIFQSDPVNKDTPILWGHGTADPIVPFRLQEVGAPQLKDLGLKVTTKAYLGMPHSSCDQELADVGEFLRAVLKAD